mgnify:CR=1 FL=1|jgi:hypothetical protein|tara:strand:+ start:559 stop:822 length:264 start_codon:yes stop_codon:yes gene_type:complete
MSELETIKQVLAEGVVMMKNVEHPTTEKHKTMRYIDSANATCRKAGEMVYKLTPNLNDMIQFVHEYVPEQYHGLINHAWSGIGEWQA